MKSRWGMQRFADFVAGILPGRLGKQISLVVIGDGFTFAVTTIAVMILARIMPVEWMGTYRQVLYLTQMAVTLVDIGIGASIYRFWNVLAPEKREIYVRMAILSSVCVAVVPSLLLALFAPFIAEAYRNQGLNLAIVIAAPIPLATIPLSLIRPALLSQGFSIRATMIETAFAVLNILSMVVPVAVGLSLNRSLAIWTVVSLLRLIALPIVFRRFLRLGKSWWNSEIFREVWSYVWPIHLARLPVYITGYMDKVIMSVYLLPRDFAVYSLGARELPFVGAIAYSVSSVLLPHLVEDVQFGNIDQLCRRWQTAALKTAFVTYIFAGFAIWNASEVMRFLFSSTYEDSAIPFRIFATLTYLRVVEFGSMSKAFGKTRNLLYAFSFDAVLVCVLGVLLTSQFGIVGMALAVVIAEIAANMYLLFRNKRLLGRPLRDFFPWRQLFILLLLSIVSSSVVSWGLGSLVNISAHDGFSALGYKLGILGLASAGTYFVLFRLSCAIGLSQKI